MTDTTGEKQQDVNIDYSFKSSHPHNALSPNLRPVPEGDPDVVFAANSHLLDQAVPKIIIVFLDGLLLLKLLGKAQYLKPPGLPVLSYLNGLLVLCFGVLIAPQETVVTPVIFLLVYECPATVIVFDSAGKVASAYYDLSEAAFDFFLLI